MHLPACSLSIVVSVNRVHGKGGQADGDVFGAVGLRTAVANPFTRMGDDGLTGVDVKLTAVVLYSQHATQNDGDLFELRALSRLHPPTGRNHVRNADVLMTAVDAPGELFDALGFVAGGGHDGWRGNQCRQ